MYWRVKSWGSMPSLTLAPPGEDKSTISRHLPGCPFLGITPKLLMCKRGNGGELKGPATLPRDTSLAKYSSTTFACWNAEGLFFLAGLSLWVDWNPSLKPWRMPWRTKATCCWSGWVASSLQNSSTFKGLTEETGGRAKLAERGKQREHEQRLTE